VELLHSSLTSLLDAAVASGFYTAKLRAAAAAFNSPDLLSATAMGVSYGEVSVNTPEADDDDDAATAGGTAPKVIMVVFIFASALGIVLYMHQTRASE
jgi:hypothetical protein